MNDTAKIAESPTGFANSISVFNSLYTGANTYSSNWYEFAAAIAPQTLFTDTFVGNLGVVTSNANCWYANGKGLALSAVTNDYNNASRSVAIATGATDLGAVEFNTSTAPIAATASAIPAANTTTNYTFANRQVASINWGGTGTVPSAVNVLFYSGTNAPNLISGSNRYNSYYNVTATGGTGTSAVLTVLAVNGSGNVTSVNVSNSGKYITSPTTTLNPFTSNTGSGSGFRANLTISYAPENIRGGEGYDAAHLPLITINTASGTGASLIAREILGDGEELELSTTRIGSISSLRVISYGYDYIASPQISLRNADLIVSNVTEGQIFVANTKIYQGTSNTNTTFVAYVDRYVSTNNHMRIYNYSGTFNVATQIISNDNTVSANVVTISYYGDGKAKATAGFENGLIRYPGIYLNEDGQLSADKKLQDSKKYHNFSYVINTENDYVKFKKALNDVVHPVGTKTFVNRVSANEANAARTNNTIKIISVTTLGNTFNISNGSNSMVATGASSNLLSIISVGDYVTLTSVERRISGTVNIGASSNVIVGTSTNFINDVQANDVIKLSTGNTSTVTEVINANTIYTYTNFGISNNTANISLLFNDTKQVTFVNANTILVSTNFTTNSTFVATYHQKLE